MPIETALGARAVDVAAEEEVVHIADADVACVEQTGPIVAECAVSVEVAPGSIARSGKKDGVAILLAGYCITFDGVAGGILHAGPCPSAVFGVEKLVKILLGRHTAGTSPVHTGGII